MYTTESARKFRETVAQRYGSWEKFLEVNRERASRGGKKKGKKGFASKKIGSDGLTGKERARLAGKKGKR